MHERLFLSWSYPPAYAHNTATAGVTGERPGALSIRYLTAWPSRDLIVAGHQQITQEWWRTRKNDFSIYVSQFVIDEATEGDPEAAQKRLDAIEEFDQLEIVDEVIHLATRIIDSGIVPARAATDAAHIAVAAVHSMDFLMTWNCAHLANAEIASAVESICRAHGFKCPRICTPEELMGM